MTEIRSDRLRFKAGQKKKKKKRQTAEEEGGIDVGEKGEVNHAARAQKEDRWSRRKRCITRNFYEQTWDKSETSKLVLINRRKGLATYVTLVFLESVNI